MADDLDKDKEKDDDEFPRKLVFKKNKDAKLKLTFKDGTMEIKLGKQGAEYHLSRKEVRKLALWLKWYAKQDDQPEEPAVVDAPT